MSDNKLPRLSVVVPVYNEVDQLDACLEQLIAQSRNIFEVLIIDNNSSDGSYQLARRYADKYPIIKTTREKNQGLVPTRNRGFRLARGDVVARIDADTRVASGWALAIRRRFARRSSLMALGGQTHYYDLPFDKFSARLSRFFIDDCNQLASGFASLYGPNMALRASVARTLARTGCHGNVNEDLDLTIHLVERGLEIDHEPAMLAYISGRRLKSSPASFFHYLLNWPRSYWRHGDRSTALVTFLMVLPFSLGQCLIFLPLRAYDPARLALSWRQLLKYSDDRIIP